MLICYQSTACSTLLLDTVTTSQMGRNSLHIMEPGHSLPCFKQPATCPRCSQISPFSLILLHKIYLISSSTQKIHLILSSTLCLGLHSTFLHSDFPTKNLYGFLCSHILATCLILSTCLTHHTQLDLITCPNIWSPAQIMKPYTAVQLPPFSCYLHWAKFCNILIFMMWRS